MPLPYGYYTFLRWIVAVSAVIAALASYRVNNSTNWKVIAMGVTAILFNPLAPVWLSRPIWLPIDLLAAGLFAYEALNKQAGVMQQGSSRTPDHVD